MEPRNNTAVTVRTRRFADLAATWAHAVPTDSATAIGIYNGLRRALGARADVSALGAATVGEQSAKLGKDDSVLIGGITTLPATGLRSWFAEATASERVAVAIVLGVTVEQLERFCAPTACPHSTPGCRSACLIVTSGRYAMARTSGARWFDNGTTRAQVCRSLMYAAAPSAALRLELDAMAAVHRKAQRLGVQSRWRVNIADDLVREANPFYATGIERLGGAYCYTKHQDRDGSHPEHGGEVVRVTLSASERWTVDDIRDAVTTGHNVAVPMAVGRGEDLPSVWHGMTVIDGDATDDRWSDPLGVVVGLRVKFTTRQQVADAVASGFVWGVSA